MKKTVRSTCLERRRSVGSWRGRRGSTALKRALATYGPEEGFGEGLQRLLARAPTASARFLAGTRSSLPQAAEAEEAARLAEEEARHAAEAERKRKLEERLGNTLCFKDLDEEFTKQAGPILHMPVFVADSCMHQSRHRCRHLRVATPPTCSCSSV